MKNVRGLLGRVCHHWGMEFRKEGHAVYYPRYHVVISTKYRRKIFKSGMGKYLERKIMDVTKYYPDIQVLEANTDEDHMHILVSIPQKMAVSWVVNIIKSNTGRARRQRFPFLDKVYWGTVGIGSMGILSPR